MSKRKKEKAVARGGVLKAKTAYLYILPFILIHFIMTVVPAIYSAVLSLYSYRGYGVARYIGFTNYKNLFKLSSARRAMGNTMIYYVGHMIPCLIFGFLLAYAVYSKLRNARLQRIFKPIFYMPQMMSAVACGLTFDIIFGTNVGVINQLLGTHIPFLTNVGIVKFPVIVAIIWRTTGWYFIILLAGMTTVNNDVVEASIVDGAGTWQQVFHIIIPLMKPIFAFLIITETMSSLKVWTEPNLISKPITNSTMPMASAPFVDVIVSNLQGGQFGMASAAGWVLFVVILIFTQVYTRLFNEKM